MLEQIARDVRAGKVIDCAWELFRLQHFPGHEHEQAAAELSEWAGENGIEVEFHARKVRDRDVVFVLLIARTAR